MAAKRGKDSFSFDFQWPYPQFKSVETGVNKSENVVTRSSLIRILWGANQKALRLGSRWVINWTPKLTDEEELLAKVNAVIAPFGCIATELGPNTVGVQGDGKVYWPSVYVSFPSETSMEQIALISNKITNEVRGISKVLMNLMPV